MTHKKALPALILLLALLLAACAGGATPTAQPESDTETETEPELDVVETPAAEEADAATKPAEAYPIEPPVDDAATAAPEAAESMPAEAYPGETDAAAQGRVFVIVPEESQASYIVDEEFFGGAVDRLGVQLGPTETIGSTSAVNGELVLNVPQSQFDGDFVVNLQSLTSDQPRRDEAIREDWLQSNLFPEATFTITSVEGLPADYQEGEEVSFQVSGDMTVREVTQPATFDVTAVLEGDTLTGTATSLMRMTDYGFQPPNIANFFTVGDEFTVQIDFTAREG